MSVAEARNIACARKITQETLHKVFGETDGSGQHTGSRNSDSNVPNVNWNPDNRKVYVNWYNPDNRNDNLRTRAEVSTIERGPHSPLSRCVPKPSGHHL